MPIVPNHIQTIDGVLAALDTIIDDCIAGKNPHGLFACLYRRVTQRVKERLGRGYFDDDARMEKLDVVFARRYLLAYTAYQQGAACSHAWQIALRAGEARQGFLLRHLLLGINAHINLDLGLAAAEIAPAVRIYDLKEDFDRINELLGAMVDETQAELNRYSPLLAWFDTLTGNSDEWLAGFSVRKARDHAWRVALEAARDRSPERETTLDTKVARWGHHLQQPGRYLQWITWVISWFESHDYPTILAELR